MRLIFELIVKRVLAAFMPVAKWENVDRVTVLGNLENLGVRVGTFVNKVGRQSMERSKTKVKNLPPLPISSNQSHR